MFFSQWIPTFSLCFDLTKYNDRTIFGRVTIETPITFLSPQVQLLKLYHLSKCQQSIFGCRTQVLLLAVTTANTLLQVLHPLPRKSVKIQGSAPAQTQNPQAPAPCVSKHQAHHSSWPSDQLQIFSLLPMIMCSRFKRSKSPFI